MGSKRVSSISFDAIVYKVQTLVDGGLRLTLDLPETAIPQAAALMECKREEIPLVFSAEVSAQKVKEVMSYGL